MKRSAKEILNEIARFYGLKKDRELADLLGISATTLSNWKRRDTYDIYIVAEQCPEVDINSLLRGKKLERNLKVVKDSPENVEEPAENYILNTEVFRIIQDKDHTIISLAEQIGRLKAELKQLKTERDNLAQAQKD